MSRFPYDTTRERILPLDNNRGVQVRFPDDLTVNEWNAVTDFGWSRVAGTFWPKASLIQAGTVERSRFVE
jgi:hypothetical protein